MRQWHLVLMLFAGLVLGLWKKISPEEVRVSFTILLCLAAISGLIKEGWGVFLLSTLSGGVAYILTLILKSFLI